MISVHHLDSGPALGELSGFRREFHRCPTRRADGLFEPADAVLCADGPVRTLVGLSLAPEHRRGHGGLYDAVDNGRIDTERLRDALMRSPLSRAADGRLVLAVDVSTWLRPDGATCTDRSFCHTCGRSRNEHRMIPGWPYSFAAALETGGTSWTALPDAVRLSPGADVAAVTVAQLRGVVGRLIAAGQWQQGDPEIPVVLDAGHDAPRIAYLLAGLPVRVPGRMRSDRVLLRPTPTPVRKPPRGRRPKHGGEFVFGDPATWNTGHVTTRTDTRLYATATAQAWNRLHPRLTRRAAWIDHDGPLPVIEGTVIRPTVEHLPSGGVNKPVWLWCSDADAGPAEVDLLADVPAALRHRAHLPSAQADPRLDQAQAAQRRGRRPLDLAAPGRSRPNSVRPARWWADLRHPWERPAEPDRLTPARVRCGFRNLHTKIARPTAAPKSPRPGPGRPLGSKNHVTAQRFDVGLLLATGQAYTRPAHYKTGTKPRRTGYWNESVRLPPS